MTHSIEVIFLLAAILMAVLDYRIVVAFIFTALGATGIVLSLLDKLH